MKKLCCKIGNHNISVIHIFFGTCLRIHSKYCHSDLTQTLHVNYIDKIAIQK